MTNETNGKDFKTRLEYLEKVERENREEREQETRVRVVQARAKARDKVKAHRNKILRVHNISKNIIKAVTLITITIVTTVIIMFNTYKIKNPIINSYFERNAKSNLLRELIVSVIIIGLSIIIISAIVSFLTSEIEEEYQEELEFIEYRWRNFDENGNMIKKEEEEEEDPYHYYI